MASSPQTGPEIADWVPPADAGSTPAINADPNQKVFSARQGLTGDKQLVGPSDWIPSEGQAQQTDKTFDEKREFATEAAMAYIDRYDEHLRTEASKELDKFSAEQINQRLRDMSVYDRNVYLQEERAHRNRQEIFAVFGQPYYPDSGEAVPNEVAARSDEEAAAAPAVGGVVGTVNEKPAGVQADTPAFSPSDELYRRLKLTEAEATRQAEARTKGLTDPDHETPVPESIYEVGETEEAKDGTSADTAESSDDSDGNAESARYDAAASETEGKKPLEEASLKQLRQESKDRGLSDTGTRATLVKRIKDDDEKSAAEAFGDGVDMPADDAPETEGEEA